MARLSQADLVNLNSTFEQRTPQELIIWVKEVFGDRAASISAMQKTGSVICQMLATIPVDMRVLFVDTGVMFAETMQTRERIIAEYGLDVVTLAPKKTMGEQTAELGILYLTPEGQDQCCRLRKIEPLLAVAGEYDAFMGSLRRADGGARGACPILAVDPQMNALRINPLVNFDDEQMEEYIQTNNVIINPLHNQGYPSVGCNRCTTPVLPNEPRRAGRWRHLGPWSVYCGINPTDTNQHTAPYVDFPEELIDRILGRQTDFMI